MSRVLDQAFDHPSKSEEAATAPLAGGIMQHGYQCGKLWGASLAASAEAHRRFGARPKAETAAIAAAQRIVALFQSQNIRLNCSELTEISKLSSTWDMLFHFFVKGTAIKCLRMSARFAPTVFDEIDQALAQEHPVIPSLPVSCASLLARKLGASQQHAIMVAGWAGGIGLCGGACGALGAAIWLKTLNKSQPPDGGAESRGSEVPQPIERFVQITGGEFECAKIIGRQFDGIEDHAEYVRSGGCAALLEALAKD